MESFFKQVQKKDQVVPTKYEVRNTGFRLMWNAERPMQIVELAHFLPTAGMYKFLIHACLSADRDLGSWILPAVGRTFQTSNCFLLILC